MMNRVALLCVAVLLLPLPALGESGVIESKPLEYAQALRWIDEGRYELAARLLDDLDGYEDSGKYALYAQALQAVREGDLTTGKIILETLVSRGFAQGGDLLSYVEALELEAAGDLSAALSAYDGLAVLDSEARAAALRDSLRDMPGTPAMERVHGDAEGIHLRWTASSGAEGYTVHRSLFSGYGFIPIDETDGLSYSDRETPPGKTYHYRVVAVNAKHRSEPSATASGAKAASDALAPPQTVAIASAVGEASLSWSPVRGATAYTVYRAYAQMGDFIRIATVASPAFHDPDAGQAAYYKICAQASGGESLPSDTAAHSSRDKAPAPLSALGLEALDVSTVRLTWDGDPGGAYLLSYQAEGASNATYLAVTGNAQTLDNLAPSTLYSFALEDVLSRVTLQESLCTDAPEAYAAHSFKPQRCGVYWVQDGSGDFYARRRARVETIERQQLLSDRERGSFAVILELTWRQTAEEKEWYELWLMRAPSGEVYTYAQPNQCDGAWESVSASLPLSPFFEQYEKDAAALAPGTYVFEVYFDGQLAGEASFILE